MNEIREMNDKILSDIEEVFRVLYERLKNNKIYCKEALGIYVTYYSVVKARNNQGLKDLSQKIFLLILNRFCEEFEDTMDDTNGFQPMIISSLADFLHITEVEAALIYGGKENVATEFKNYCQTKGIRYCEGQKNKITEVDEHKAMRAAINVILAEKMDQERYKERIAGDIEHHKWDTHYADGHSKFMVDEKAAKIKANQKVNDSDILKNALTDALNPPSSQLKGRVVAEEVLIIYEIDKKSAACIVGEIFEEISRKSKTEGKYKSFPENSKVNFFLMPNVTHMGVGIAKFNNELWVTVRYREIKD